MMSADVAWIGQFAIDLALNSVMPVRQVQPIGVRMIAGVQRVRHPILRPRPILIEQSVVLVEHLMRGEC